MNTAKNSGLPGVGVTWGFHGVNSFKTSTPDIFADDAETLYNIINGNK